MGLFPIKVDGTQISIPNLPLAEGYTRFRRAVVDGEIPLTMPIGFRINTPTLANNTNAIERNRGCEESLVAIAANVSHIIFTGVIGTEVCCDEMLGDITTDTANWRCRGQYVCRPVTPNKHILTAVAPVSLQFRMNKAAGYHSMAENAALIGEAKYFPITTVHTLADYVSVLPLTSDKIEVRYHKGMTPDLFQSLWDSGMN